MRNQLRICDRDRKQELADDQPEIRTSTLNKLFFCRLCTQRKSRPVLYACGSVYTGLDRGIHRKYILYAIDLYTYYSLYEISTRSAKGRCGTASLTVKPVATKPYSGVGCAELAQLQANKRAKHRSVVRLPPAICPGLEQDNLDTSGSCTSNDTYAGDSVRAARGPVPGVVIAGEASLSRSAHYATFKRHILKPHPSLLCHDVKCNPDGPCFPASIRHVFRQ